MTRLHGLMDEALLKRGALNVFLRHAQRKKVRASNVKLVQKGAIAAIGGSAALVGFTAMPAYAAGQFTIPNPYPVPQSSPGVLNLAAVDITASGFTPGTFWFAQLCDGLPANNPNWTPAADCGPATSSEKVPTSGTLSYPGTDTTGYALLMWHGSNANDTLNGEQAFNCLDTVDDPNGTTTVNGAQPIDPAIPAWGSSAGGNLNNPPGFQGSAGSAPCQVRISQNAGGFSTTDIYDPISLAAPSGGVPESPMAIALPIGAAAVIGGGAFLALRRRRNHAAA